MIVSSRYWKMASKCVPNFPTWFGVSTEVIDILSVAGIKSPDISVLSEEFLKEMAGMEHKNLAVEALRKLLAGETKSRTRTNVVKNRQIGKFEKIH